MAGQSDTALPVADVIGCSVGIDVPMNHDIFNVHVSVSPFGSTNNRNLTHIRKARNDSQLGHKTAKTFLFPISTLKLALRCQCFHVQ